MKWLLTIMTSLILVGCSSSTGVEASQLARDANIVGVSYRNDQASIGKPANLQIVVQQAIAHQNVVSKTQKMDKVIRTLRKRVGRTPYVFSGISPRYGWDCSGLVLWTYSQFGVKLTHSASAEVHAGKRVQHPKVGDIVGFGWRGWSGAGHVGIVYKIDDKGKVWMIHSPHPGARTAITSVQSWAKENGNTKVTYNRVVNTL